MNNSKYNNSKYVHCTSKLWTVIKYLYNNNHKLNDF